jgi:phosphoribosyl 1,2-cyclic phosphate phosphodiesterase
LNHEIDYQDLRRRCPPGVEPGYDGLVIEVEG